MFNEPLLEPAPEDFRELFTGQALGHLDEFVLSWRMAGHPISWSESVADFEVTLENGPAILFKIHAPKESTPAGVEFDSEQAERIGMSPDFATRISEELSQIGKISETSGAQIRVPLGRFSRGDRKVFLAYTLTVARFLAYNP